VVTRQSGHLDLLAAELADRAFALARALQPFNWRAIAESHLQLYAQLLREKA
jgi:hypothetical protein